MPLKKHKIVMLALSMMLLFSDLHIVPAYAEPDTNPVMPIPNDPEVNDPEVNDPEVNDPETNDPEVNDPSGPTDPDVPEYIASSNNYLASLSVSDFKLSPEFDPNTYEYSLNISGEYDQIEIKAGVQDGKAWVSGIGKFDVSYEVGSYDFRIVVTAENGSTRSYVIHLTVSSDPFLFTYCDGEQLGFVIKGLDDLIVPEGFSQRNGSFGGKKITMFSNASFPFNLVWLQNDNKKEEWFCYQDGTVTGMFCPLVINKTKYYYAGVSAEDKKQSGYTYSDLSVLGEKLNGWKVNSDSSKIMLYLYDNAGNADYYIYDTDDQTIIRRREFEVTETKANRSILKSPVFITGLIVVVIAAIFGAIFLKAGKKPQRRKEEEEINLDNTVELVRTGKVKIYADTPNEEVEKTKEYNFDLKDKQEQVKEEVVLPIIVEKEEIHVEEKKASLDKQAETVVEELSVIDEEIQPKKKKPFFGKKEESVVEGATVIDEDIQPKKKISFFGKKEETSTFEEMNEPKQSFIDKNEKSEKEEIILEEVIQEQNIKKPMNQSTDDLDEQEALQEIQKYLDRLFYFDELE